MAKLYVDITDNLIDVAKTVAANPNTNVVLNGTPISNQTLVSLASNQAMQGSTSANSVVPYTGTNFTGMSNNLGAQPITLNPSTLALSNSPTITTPQSLSDIAKAQNNTATVLPYVNPNLELPNVTTPQSLSDIAKAQNNTATVLPYVNPNLELPNVTKPSADTLAILGGTGTAKVADTGTVIDNTKLNTQGGGSALSTSDINKIPTTGGSALSTGDINKIPTTGGSALSTGDVNKMSTSPAATSPPNTINTGSIPALTTADLTNWYNTQPKGITADQLKTALGEQQTALSGQNTEFLKNWNSSADALKTNILSGVDTKNQAFGTQATQGFMDAFKNFQIPTNQQTGVNLGNYNDNRNAAADQWWSQYVTGRR